MIEIPDEVGAWLAEDDVRSLKISVVHYAMAWNLRMEDVRSEYGITMNVCISTPKVEVSNQLKHMVQQMKKKA